VLRARILVLAARGHSNAETSRAVGVSSPTLRRWRTRYTADGLAQLDDLPRPGRPMVYDEEATIAAMLRWQCR